jgi:hypothetical protein
MHVHVPAPIRTNLRAFTSYINNFDKGTIIRLRTFRPIFGVKSHIMPLEELQLVTVKGGIPALEQNVIWNSSKFGARTLFGEKKGWYLQPGKGGQEMDSFWIKLGMDSRILKKERDAEKLKMTKAREKKGQLQTRKGHGLIKTQTQSNLKEK